MSTIIGYSGKSLSDKLGIKPGMASNSFGAGLGSANPGGRYISGDLTPVTETPMNARQIKGAALALLSLLGCARPVAPPPGPAPAAVRAAIDSQFSKLSDAYRNRDGTAFAAIYTTDGVSSSPQGTLTGRPAIEAAMKQVFANVISTANDTVITEDFVMADDRAIQSGHVTWTETDKGKKPAKLWLNFVFNWRRGPDGVWRIGRDLDYQTMTATK